MAGKTHHAGGIDHLRLATGPVVLDQLELEAAGGLVVADDLEHGGFLLVADVEPVLEEERGGRGWFAIDGNHDAGIGEVVRCSSGALQGAPERNQDPFGGRQGTGRVLGELGIEAGEERGEREGQFDGRLSVAVNGEKLVEKRATGGGQVGAGGGRVDNPGRQRGEGFSRCRHDRPRAEQPKHAGQEEVAQAHEGMPSLMWSVRVWRRRRAGPGCRASNPPGPCRS